MTNRHLLHKNDVGDFARWLLGQGIQTREGRGDYQVLQVLWKKNWQVIYERSDTHAGHPIVHMTVPTPIEHLAERFYRERRADKATHPLIPVPEMKPAVNLSSVRGCLNKLERYINADASEGCDCRINVGCDCKNGVDMTREKQLLAEGRKTLNQLAQGTHVVKYEPTAEEWIETGKRLGYLIVEKDPDSNRQYAKGVLP